MSSQLSWFYLVRDLMANTNLTRLCDKNTPMGDVINITEALFRDVLLRAVANSMMFPSKEVRVATPMSVGGELLTNPRTFLHAEIVDPDTRVVVVNVLRAGNVPAMACHRSLTGVVNSRIDHFGAGRVTDENGAVTGTSITYEKKDSARGCFVIVPDPMGATGGTDVRVLEAYPDIARAEGIALMHLIVTPEYLRRIQALRESKGWVRNLVRVFALRLDKGMSSREEMRDPDLLVGRGLTDEAYIVPGAGDMGGRLTGVP